MSDRLALRTTGIREIPASFGVFRVLERLAEGGMGVVLRAEDVRNGEQVAIKTALSTRDADAAAIQREIVALSGLRHPGIVRVRGYGVQLSGPWIALELLDGRTLADELSWCWPETRGFGERRPRTDDRPTTPARAVGDRIHVRSREPYPMAGGGHLAEVLAIVQQLCLALDHLHERGLVHRDVKPANVFLRPDGRTTLFDFGLACSVNEAPDRTLCVGTMEYAAPEQICGAPPDRRADIYSLGCLLYELVTGRPPFRGDSTSEIAERQMKREPLAPSQLIADVPGRLDDLILSMLAKAPAHRPGDAAEVGLRLAAIARRMPDRSDGSSAMPFDELEVNEPLWRQAG